MKRGHGDDTIQSMAERWKRRIGLVAEMKLLGATDTRAETHWKVLEGGKNGGRMLQIVKGI